MHSLRSLAAIGLMAFSFAAIAQPQTYRIGGAREAMQVFTVESQTDFEDFTGLTHRITGSITFDPNRRTGSGRIAVDLASIDTGIALRNEHMRSEQWLNTARHPQAVFETTRVRHKSGDTYEVVGNLTLKGVTREVTVDASVRRMPASDATRRAGFQGDVLQVRTQFNIRLSDYNVRIPAAAQGKVADSVTLKLTVFGQAQS